MGIEEALWEKPNVSKDNPYLFLNPYQSLLSPGVSVLASTSLSLVSIRKKALPRASSSDRYLGSQAWAPKCDLNLWPQWEFRNKLFPQGELQVPGRMWLYSSTNCLYSPFQKVMGENSNSSHLPPWMRPTAQHEDGWNRTNTLTPLAQTSSKAPVWSSVKCDLSKRGWVR